MTAAVRWIVLAGALATVALGSTRLSGAAPSVSPQDRGYLVAAHEANLAAIAAAEAAQRQASAAGVRALAEKLAADHRRLDDDLREVAGQLRVTLPAAPTGAQQHQLAQLIAFSGDRFDRAWITHQIGADNQAAQLGRVELTEGDYAGVTSLARAADPVLQGHLSMLRQLRQLPRGQIPIGSTAKSDSWFPDRSSWARPASRVLTGVGLVLIAFAALFPGRAGPDIGPLSGGPRPRGRFLRWPRQRPAGPVRTLLPGSPGRPAARHPSTWQYLATWQPAGQRPAPVPVPPGLRPGASRRR